MTGDPALASEAVSLWAGGDWLIDWVKQIAT